VLEVKRNRMGGREGGLKEAKGPGPKGIAGIRKMYK
jgi:hypothetical protein